MKFIGTIITLTWAWGVDSFRVTAGLIHVGAARVVSLGPEYLVLA